MESPGGNPPAWSFLLEEFASAAEWLRAHPGDHSAANYGARALETLLLSGGEDAGAMGVARELSRLHPSREATWRFRSLVALSLLARGAPPGFVREEIVGGGNALQGSHVMRMLKHLREFPAGIVDSESKPIMEAVGDVAERKFESDSGMVHIFRINENSKQVMRRWRRRPVGQRTRAEENP